MNKFIKKRHNWSIFCLGQILILGQLRVRTKIFGFMTHQTANWFGVKSNLYQGSTKFMVSITNSIYFIYFIDEILVNAADNFQRDKKMDKIMIDIDPVKNTIKVWNNGRGIPITIHKEHGCYVPEMIFG